MSVGDRAAGRAEDLPGEELLEGTGRDEDVAGRAESGALRLSPRGSDNG